RVHGASIGPHVVPVESHPARPGAPVDRTDERRDLAQSGAAGPRGKRERLSCTEDTVHAQILAEHDLSRADSGRDVRAGWTPVDGLEREAVDRIIKERVRNPELRA